MAPTEEQLKVWMLGGLDGDSAAQAALLRALVPLLRSFYGRRLGSAGACNAMRAASFASRPACAYLFHGHTARQSSQP